MAIVLNEAKVTGHLNRELVKVFRLLRVLKLLRVLINADFSWTESAWFQSVVGGVIAFNALIMGPLRVRLWVLVLPRPVVVSWPHEVFLLRTLHLKWMFRLGSTSTTSEVLGCT